MKMVGAIGSLVEHELINTVLYFTPFVTCIVIPSDERIIMKSLFADTVCFPDLFFFLLTTKNITMNNATTNIATTPPAAAPIMIPV